MAETVENGEVISFVKEAAVNQRSSSAGLPCVQEKVGIRIFKYGICRLKQYFNQIIHTEMYMDSKCAS